MKKADLKKILNRGTSMITFDHVTKKYRTNIGLDDVSVHINKGDKATTFVYSNERWNPVTPYIYNNEEWKATHE